MAGDEMEIVATSPLEDAIDSVKGFFSKLTPSRSTLKWLAFGAMLLGAMGSAGSARTRAAAMQTALGAFNLLQSREQFQQQMAEERKRWEKEFGLKQRKIDLLEEELEVEKEWLRKTVEANKQLVETLLNPKKLANPNTVQQIRQTLQQKLTQPPPQPQPQPQDLRDVVEQTQRPVPPPLPQVYVPPPVPQYGNPDEMMRMALELGQIPRGGLRDAIDNRMKAVLRAFELWKSRGGQ